MLTKYCVLSLNTLIFMSSASSVVSEGPVMSGGPSVKDLSYLVVLACREMPEYTLLAGPASRIDFELKLLRNH